MGWIGSDRDPLRTSRIRAACDCWLTEAIQADRAYHDAAVDGILKWLGIKPLIAKRNTPHGSGLGTTRWVVERTFSWIRGFRRLRTRFDRRDFIYHAWNSLAAAVICWRILTE